MTQQGLENRWRSGNLTNLILSPLFDGSGYSTGRSLLHASSVDVVAAQDHRTNDHQNRAVETPVAQCRIGTHELTRSGFRVEDTVHAVLIVRVVLAPVQHSLPVVVGYREGDAGIGETD